MADGEMVGRISIHHELNDALRVEGGHIGYDTVPTFRGRGVASEMLHQALPLAKTLGLTSVLLTCDDTNPASIRVIERNGGVLHETKSLGPNRPLKRYYWITLEHETMGARTSSRGVELDALRNRFVKSSSSSRV